MCGCSNTPWPFCVRLFEHPLALAPICSIRARRSYFSDKQCGAIRDALLIAGVPADRAHIIPESVAELLCYHHSHYAELNVSEPTTIVMVCSLAIGDF